jgi:hypothetical protein
MNIPLFQNTHRFKVPRRLQHSASDEAIELPRFFTRDDFGLTYP